METAQRQSEKDVIEFANEEVKSEKPVATEDKSKATDSLKTEILDVDKKEEDLNAE